MTDKEIVEKAVNNICSLYPPDSDFPATAAKGQWLLMQAIYRNWHTLPDGILLEMERLCIKAEKDGL